MIVVFSPNTAHEVIVGVPKLVPGAVLRAQRAVERIGGKGVNVARFSGRMGVGVRLVAITDDAGHEALSDEPDLGLATIQVVPSGVRARTDVIVVDGDGRATVLNGTAPALAPAVVERATARLLDGLASGDLLVLTGSLPAGASVDLYASLIGSARRVGARTLLDASGGWLHAALRAIPDVVKVSTAELAAARDLTSANAWARGRDAVPEPSALILTNGRRGARLWTDDGRWTIAAAPQEPVNPIGAGDAVCAGLVVQLAAGATLPEALAEGVAWGAAKVREFDLAVDPSLARSLRSGVNVVRRATPRAVTKRSDTPATR